MIQLAHLFLNESAELDFALEVSWTDSKAIKARFIIEGPDYSVICKCNESAGTITALVPKLSGVLPPGEYKSSLEIIVDGKHFQPLTESISFENPVMVNAVLQSKPKVVATDEIKLHTSAVTVRTGSKMQYAPQVKEDIKKSSFSDYVNPEDLYESVADEKLQKLNDMQQRIKEYESRLTSIKKRS